MAKRHRVEITSNIQNFTPKLAEPSALKNKHSLSHNSDGREQARTLRLKQLGKLGKASKGESIWNKMTPEDRIAYRKAHCGQPGLTAEAAIAPPHPQPSKEALWEAMDLFENELRSPHGLSVADARYALSLGVDPELYQVGYFGPMVDAEGLVSDWGPRMSLLSFTALAPLDNRSTEPEHMDLLREIIRCGADVNRAIFLLGRASLQFEDVVEAIKDKDTGEEFDVTVTDYEKDCYEAMGRIAKAAER